MPGARCRTAPEPGAVTSLLYAFTPEQEELRRVLRELLRAKPAARAPYDGGAPGPDRELWLALAEVGVAGLGVPEDDGGSGGDVVDLVVVAEEVGRAVAPVPFVGTAVAASVLAGTSAPDDLRRRMAAIATGEVIAGIAVDVEQASSDRARGHRAGGDAPGDGHLVFDAGAAQLLVVGGSDGRAGLVVDPEIEVLPSIDRTRPLARCRWAPGAVVPLDGADLDAAGRLLATLYAAEAAGVAADALERAASHARERHQFGLPIGTFQAVKHRLADMLLDVERARSAAYAAAWALRASDGPAAQPAVHMAQAVATEAAVRVVSGAIQLHGGIGVTWEHDLHLHLRRAKSLELAHGSPGWHYEQLAHHLLGPVSR